MEDVIIRIKEYQKPESPRNRKIENWEARETERSKTGKTEK